MIETTDVPVSAPAESASRPPLAVAGIAAIAVTSFVALLFSAGRYGFFGDELYFLAAGRRLSFGYADQGPVLPLLADAMDFVAPGSLLALRMPSVLLTIAALVLSAVIARELGGGRAAQLLTAFAYGVSPFLLLQGNMLTTNAVDTALWVLITWLLVRWVRVRQDSLLLLAAVVTAVDMQVKWLIPFFWVAVGIGVLGFGPRELLRRPLLWFGAVIVIAATVPTLVWQAHHGWPQLAMGGQVRSEQAFVGGPVTFLPLALVVAGLLGGILLSYGTWRLLRSDALRPYRFLGATMLLLLVAFAVTGGRSYYAAGLYAVVMAAGSVEITGSSRRWLKVAALPVSAASLCLVVMSLPWQSPDRIEPAKNDIAAAMAIGIYGQFGWPELAAATDDAYRTLTAAQRRDAVTVTNTYWQAAALDKYRDTHHLPAVFSPSRGFGYFGSPPDSATTVVYIGGTLSELTQRFGTVAAIGRIDTRLGFPGNTKDVTIWKCAGPVRPWSELWPSLMRL